MSKKIFNFMIIGLICVSPIFLYAQEMAVFGERKMTEGQFAVQLVRQMKLQHLLPPAPLPDDHIAALEMFGVAPLMGWKTERELSRESYVVIMAMAAGKESVVHKKAQEACDKYVEIINRRWREKYESEGRWVTLEELLKDEAYFPAGPPRCPYGTPYKAGRNRRATPHKHPGWEKKARGPSVSIEEKAREQVGDIELVP